MDPEDVEFPDSDFPNADFEKAFGDDDNMDRENTKRFLKAAGATGMNLDDEVDDILKTVDSTPNISRRRQGILWDHAYHDEADRYRGFFAEKADKSVLYANPESLRRFVSTKWDPVSVSRK